MNHPTPPNFGKPPNKSCWKSFPWKLLIFNVMMLLSRPGKYIHCILRKGRWKNETNTNTYTHENQLIIKASFMRMMVRKNCIDS